MTKDRLMSARNLVLFAAIVLLGFTIYRSIQKDRDAKDLADVLDRVQELYVEDVDRGVLFESAMHGICGGLDPYSEYLSPQLLKRVRENLTQEFGGIGLQVAKPGLESPLLVMSPYFETPAYHAGLCAGDRILAIDGESTVGMTRREAVERIRGKPGEPVVLRVQHATDALPFDVSVARDTIVRSSVLGDIRRTDGSWDFHLERSPRIGYLRIDNFGKHTVDQLKEVLRSSDASTFEALILDLRGNGGGQLKAAAETCDLFIKDGPIVTVRGRGGDIRQRYAATPSMIVPETLPVAVLVDKYTASASEVVAACLQDHGRAVVVGERTLGKGSVQNVIELSNGRGALKLTTASYWRPSGQNIHRTRSAADDDVWGVQPNEGYAVVTDESARLVIFRQRRRRDVAHGLSGNEATLFGKEGAQAQAMPTDLPRNSAGSGAASSSADSDVDSNQPVEDQVLNKAVEYLEGRLRSAVEESNAA